jgi:hypothetical protein
MVYGVTTDTHLTNSLVLTGSPAYGVLYMIPLFILKPNSIIFGIDSANQNLDQ